MNPDATPAAPARDALWELEQGVHTTRRVRGALRAVQCLVQPWRHPDPEGQVAENLLREDLANLLEVIHSDLTLQLDQLEGSVYLLQGYGQVAAQALGRARGR